MWWCVAVFVLAGSAVRATTVERLGLPELTGRADQVFVGTCQSAEAVDVDGQPHVRYRFRVDQALKGPAQGQVDLLLPGGRRDGVTLRIPGMPTFSPGEEAVLFLVGTRPGPVWPAGLGQGAFRILREGAAKPARAVQQLGGLSLVGGAAKPAVAPPGGMDLEELLAQVRALVQHPAGGQSREAR
ncbi:MAG: hypothetical protein AB1505_21130 [Candidatus Latescibacterota bacterium]